MTKEQFEKSADICQKITTQIVEAIEAGVKSSDYSMPWHITGEDPFAPVNAGSNWPYRGVNVLSLWLQARKHEYPTGVWATFRQWQSLGAHVRKGEKASLVVFWKLSERGNGSGEEREGDEEKKQGSLIAKAYSVFNAAQVEGYSPLETPRLSEDERIQAAEQFFSALGADIRHGGIEAAYVPSGDYIQLPRFEAFHDAFGYYSTLGHELIHWVGARKRLNRDLTGRFGSSAYAAEELVAELGAAFLCSTLGITNKPRADHAAYVASWLELLKRDKRAVFTAASKAQQAVDWMLTKQDEIPALSAEAGE
jgi:antirestriction protein ArdC